MKTATLILFACTAAIAQPTDKPLRWSSVIRLEVDSRNESLRNQIQSLLWSRLEAIDGVHVTTADDPSAATTLSVLVVDLPRDGVVAASVLTATRIPDAVLDGQVPDKGFQSLFATARFIDSLRVMTGSLANIDEFCRRVAANFDVDFVQPGRVFKRRLMERAP